MVALFRQARGGRNQSLAEPYELCTGISRAKPADERGIDFFGHLHERAVGRKIENRFEEVDGRWAVEIAIKKLKLIEGDVASRKLHDRVTDMVADLSPALTQDCAGAVTGNAQL